MSAKPGENHVHDRPGTRWNVARRGGAEVTAILVWIGVRARWALVVGVVAALAAPDLAEALRPALPFLVAVIYGFAMARIDLAATLRQALRPRRLTATAALAVVMMTATPAAMYALASIGGLSHGLTAALVHMAAAPPIGSAAALCFMLRLNGVLALELTILCSLLCPFLSPLVSELLLGDAMPIEPAALGLRLAAMILGGAALAVLLRWALRPRWIAANATAFDGMSAVGMAVMVLPLFEGVGAAVLAQPGLALGVGLLVFAANWGAQSVVFGALSTSRAVAPPTAGALAVCWGNRNTALLLAALPPDPLFTLFVALYQLPMYLTPLAGSAFYRRAREDATEP